MTLIKLRAQQISNHIIWVMVLLEAITVTLLATFSHYLPSGQQLKSPLNGFIIAFIGAYITLLILNRFIRRLKIEIDGNPIILVSPVLLIAFWSGLLLSALFIIQEYITHAHLTTSTIVNLMIAGFISAALSTLLTYWVYIITTKLWPTLRINIISINTTYSLDSLSIYLVALLVGLYELIALPIINLWQWFPPHLQIPASTFTGAVGGGVGMVVVVFLYRLIRNKFNVYFLFYKKLG